METLLKGLESPVLGPVYALVAGILTSASPCAVAAIPVLVGDIAGSRNRAASLASFVTGLVTSLTVAGLIAAMAGRFLALSVPAVRWIAGLAFVLAGLSYTGIFGGSRTCRVPLAPEVLEGIEQGGKEGMPRRTAGDRGTGTLCGVSIWRAFALGTLYGLSASPCATPALVAILTLVAVSGSPARGALLLFAYSLGQSFPAILSGIAASRLTVLLERHDKMRLLRTAGGVVVLSFGLYLLLRPYIAFF